MFEIVRSRGITGLSLFVILLARLALMNSDDPTELIQEPARVFAADSRAVVWQENTPDH